MALSRVPDNLPAYNPNKSTLAFGDRALPKIRRELCSVDIEVVQQALLLLDDLLHKPENITGAVREGLVKSLSLLLISDDSVIKYRSCSCLQLVAEHAIGRQAFIKLNIINSLSKLFDDLEPTVRLNAHLAVEMCARTKEGVQGLLDNLLIPVLVERFLIEEDPEIKILTLDSLHWCLTSDPFPGLECRSIERLQPSLSHESAEIKWRVARCLYALTVPHSGKRAACECQLVCDLVPLLSDMHHLVKTHVAGVLMSIAVITDGKYAVLNNDGLDKLVLLLSDPTPTVRLNSIKVLTLIAEAPSGKDKLMKSLSKVIDLEADEDQVISRAAETARKTITWLP